MRFFSIKVFGTGLSHSGASGSLGRSTKGSPALKYAAERTDMRRHPGTALMPRMPERSFRSSITLRPCYPLRGTHPKAEGLNLFDRAHQVVVKVEKTGPKPTDTALFEFRELASREGRPSVAQFDTRVTPVSIANLSRLALGEDQCRPLRSELRYIVTASEHTRRPPVEEAAEIITSR